MEQFEKFTKIIKIYFIQFGNMVWFGWFEYIIQQRVREKEMNSLMKMRPRGSKGSNDSLHQSNQEERY